MKILWTINMNGINEEGLLELNLMYWNDSGIFKSDAVLVSAYTIYNTRLYDFRTAYKIPMDVEVFVDSGGARILSKGEENFELSPKYIYWIGVMAKGNYVFTLDYPINIVKHGLNENLIIKNAYRTYNSMMEMLEQYEKSNTKVKIYTILHHFSSTRLDLMEKWYRIVVKPFIDDDRVVGLGVGTQQVANPDINRVVDVLKWLVDADIGKIRRAHFFAVMGKRSLIFHIYSRLYPNVLDVLSFDGDHSWSATYGEAYDMMLNKVGIPYFTMKKTSRWIDPEKCGCIVCKRWDEVLKKYKDTHRKSYLRAWGVAHTALAYYRFYRKLLNNPEETAREYGIIEEYESLEKLLLNNKEEKNKIKQKSLFDFIDCKTIYSSKEK